VDLLEDESAARPKDGDLLAHVFADLLGCAAREDEVSIAAAAPEGDLAPEVGLQPSRLHARAGNLHRVDGVQSGLDQVGEEGPHAAAAVEHDFDVGQLLSAVPHAGVAWLEELLVHGRRELRPALRAQVVAK